MSRTFAFFILLFFAALNPEVRAQLLQPHRFEHEIKSSENSFNVVSLRKEGLALVRELNHFAHGKRKWELEFLDTTLVQYWSAEVELESRLVLVGFEHTPHHLYLLYREGESESHNFQLLTVDFVEKTWVTSPIRFELTFRMTHFTIAGNNAVFGGYVVNEPVVLLYDPASEHPKVLPGLLIKDMTLLDVRMNQNNSFNVLLYEKKGREERKLILRTFDPDGNQLIDDAIEIDARYSILTGITNGLEREDLIVVGTYGEAGSKQALGFYTIVIDPFEEQPVNYTDFGSLTHFLDNLKPRKQARIKAKAQLLRAEGKAPDYRTYVMPYRLEERPNGYCLLAEQYFPSNTVNPYPSAFNAYNPYAFSYYPYGMYPGNANRYYNSPYYPYSVRNSDVRMVQSIVLELNPSATITRDASMKLEDYRIPNLEQVSDFTYVHDSVVMVYKLESEIISQEEAGDPDEKPVIRKAAIRFMTDNDRLRNENEHEGGVRFWYDHHFYVWGYQTIRDATKPENQTRRVFYVNRITMR